MIATSDDGLCEDNARMSASFLHQDGMDFVISLARLWIGGNAYVRLEPESMILLTTADMGGG
jgi:hypothetical protein